MTAATGTFFTPITNRGNTDLASSLFENKDMRSLVLDGTELRYPTVSSFFWWLNPIKEGWAIGTQTLQSLVASMSTFDAVLVRSTLKALASSMSTFAATLVRLTLKALTAGMSTFAGLLARLTLHVLASSMSTFAATLSRAMIFGKTLSAAMSTFAGTLSRAVLFASSLSASLSTFAANLGTFTLKTLVSSLSTFAGILAGVKVSGATFSQNFIASMALFSATLSRVAWKALRALMTLFGAEIGSYANTSVLITHTDGTTVTVRNYMAGISNNTDGKGWILCLIPYDPNGVPMTTPLQSGDSYQTLGVLPEAKKYGNRTLIDDVILKVGTVIKVP